MANYGKYQTTQSYSGLTPSTQPLKGLVDVQVKNSEGLFVFEVTPETLLTRFLVLGTTSPTFYQNAQELTESALDALAVTISDNSGWVISHTKKMVHQKRVIRKSPALFLMAFMSNHVNPDVRVEALKAGMGFAKTGSQLLEFVSYIKLFRSFGRSVKKAISEWYLSRSAEEVLFQANKYPSRYGFSHRDLLRITHPTPKTSEMNDAFKYIVSGEHPFTLPTKYRYRDSINDIDPATVEAERAVEAMVNHHKMPREMLPSQLLSKDYTWEILFKAGMPQNALLRNLGTLASKGVFDRPSNVEVLIERLNGDMGNVHPWDAFVTRMIYATGAGLRGNNTWKADDRIVDALDELFTRSFTSFKPNGKRKLIAIDISLSMGGGRVADHERPFKLAAATAYIMKKAEPNADVFTFKDYVLYVPEEAFNYSLSDFISMIKQNLGGPTHAHDVVGHASQHAINKGTNKILNPDMYEEIIFLTDNEANGKEHTWELLDLYRKEHVLNCKFVSVAFAPNNFSLANPKDPLSMDFCGFDSAAFKVMYDFLNN